MKVAISTNVRDEDNVLEWVAYHKLIGFDHILVVDHRSIKPVANYLKVPDTTVIRYNGQPVNPKIHLLNNIVLPFMRRHKIDWFIHLDIDEYLNLNSNYESIHELLGSLDPAVNIVAFNWVMFGSNGHNKQPPGLVMENFIKCARSHPAVKTLVKTAVVVNCTHVHFWSVKQPRGVDANGRAWRVGFANTTTRGIDDLAYINHYNIQSYQYYLKRKVNRRTDDGARRTRKSRTQIHTLYNSVENKSICKFIPAVKAAIKEYSSCLSK